MKPRKVANKIMHKTYIAFVLMACGVVCAQTVTPAFSSPIATSEGSHHFDTLTVNYVAGVTPATSINWTLALPAGVTVTWQPTNGNTLACDASGNCVLTGGPVTGVVAVALVDFPVGQFAILMHKIMVGINGGAITASVALPDVPLSVTTIYPAVK